MDTTKIKAKCKRVLDDDQYPSLFITFLKSFHMEFSQITRNYSPKLARYSYHYTILRMVLPYLQKKVSPSDSESLYSDIDPEWSRYPIIGIFVDYHFKRLKDDNDFPHPRWLTDELTKILNDGSVSESNKQLVKVLRASIPIDMNNMVLYGREWIDLIQLTKGHYFRIETQRMIQDFVLTAGSTMSTLPCYDNL